jgi:O-methyltransferase involved in polyketide biosynthesis
MGAGLDTLAIDSLRGRPALRIFEIDHRATQSWKRAKLSAARIQIPKNIIFASVNFDEISLEVGPCSI